MQAFAHAPRMHAVDEIPSTVPSDCRFPDEICRVASFPSRSDELGHRRCRKALEQRLPLPVFVEFAEQCDRRFGPKAIQTGHRFSEPIGPAGCPAEFLTDTRNLLGSAFLSGKISVHPSRCRFSTQFVRLRGAGLNPYFSCPTAINFPVIVKRSVPLRTGQKFDNRLLGPTISFRSSNLQHTERRKL